MLIHLHIAYGITMAKLSNCDKEQTAPQVAHLPSGPLWKKVVQTYNHCFLRENWDETETLSWASKILLNLFKELSGSAATNTVLLDRL